MNENGFNNTRATIKDVAVKANVSLSTVSRALREPDKTPAETVSKVRAAAEALNYVYNATAGSLSKRRSDTIGILLPSPTYAAFGVNLMAIQKTCSERNYSCKVALSQFSPEEERLAMRRFHEQRIGGLILVGLDMSNVEYMKTLEAAGIPCIILWEVPDESVNYIGIDNARSIYTSVKYLIDLGHKRIGFLVGPMTCARRTIDRMEGYKKVLADNGIPFDPELIRLAAALLPARQGIHAGVFEIAGPPDGGAVRERLSGHRGHTRHHRGGAQRPGGHFGLRLRRHRHRRLLQPAADEHQDALLRNGPDGGEHHDLGH